MNGRGEPFSRTEGPGLGPMRPRWEVRQGFAPAEAAMAPEGQFTRRSWTAAVRAGSTVAMHIESTGMDGPYGGFLMHRRGLNGAAVVLLHDDLPHLETCSAQGPKQHVAVVLKGLEPGAWSRPYR